MPSRRDLLAAVAGSGLLGGVGRAAADRSTTTPTEVATRPERWPMYRQGPGNAGALPDVRGPTIRPAVAWQRDLGSVPTAPAVVPGGVLVGGKLVRMVDADEGVVLWRAEPAAPVFTQPVVADDTVFLGHAVGVEALSLGSGERRWSARLRGTPETVAVADGVVYADAEDGPLYALDAGDGSERWRLDTGGGPGVAPTVADRTVFVGGKAVLAVDAATGKERWRATLPDGVPEVGPLAVGDGRVYGVGEAGAERAVVVAYGAADGDVRWTRTFRKAAGVPAGDPVLQGDELLVAPGPLRTIDADTGDVRWTAPVDPTVGSTPAVAGPVAYLRGGRSRVEAVTAAGERLWALSLDAALSTAPVVGGGTVYVADDDGTLYAVRESEETATPTGTPFGYDWVRTWTPVAGVLGAAHVVGPLVLGGLVGLAERLRDRDDGERP